MLDFNILMEYAEGKSLREVMEQPNYVPDRRLIFKLFGQLMMALGHIHKHKLIHRDIKPENIFVDGKC